MFGKKKENEAPEPTISDVFYLVSLIAEKAGVDLDDSEEVKEETATTDKVEENAIVDTDKFFKEELEEGDHDDSIKENEDGIDKNHLEDEIVAIALRPEAEFKGGKEEKDAAIRKLLTKGLYSPSTRSEKDNSCKKNEVEDKKEEEKQEDKQKATGEDKLEKDTEKRPIFNSIMQSFRKPVKNSILTRREMIAESNKKYSL